MHRHVPPLYWDPATFTPQDLSDSIHHLDLNVRIIVIVLRTAYLSQITPHAGCVCCINLYARAYALWP